MATNDGALVSLKWFRKVTPNAPPTQWHIADVADRYVFSERVTVISMCNLENTGRDDEFEAVRLPHGQQPAHTDDEQICAACVAWMVTHGR